MVWKEWSEDDVEGVEGVKDVEGFVAGREDNSANLAGEKSVSKVLCLHRTGHRHRH